ncbi:MAG: glycoside hydrolase family 2 TIM barrel-domain containing protein [Acidobacteriota bacterium]
MLERLTNHSTDHLGRGYPRPQLRRDDWISLNGPWDFAFDPTGAWSSPSDVTWDRTIAVPFAPESAASGVGVTSFFRVSWYRRTLAVPALRPGQRLLLHFGAIDYEATIWARGLLIGQHVGGYTPFTVDLTSTTVGTATIEIVVRAEDDPHDLAKPRGKQDWQLEPHSIWYPRTSGIWQTVWMEVVPETWLSTVRWTPNLARWEIGLEARVSGVRRERLRLHVRLQCRTQVIADDSYAVIGGEVHRRIALSDPGIDDYRNELLWSPESPTIIDVGMRLWGEREELLDEVVSYTALRSIATQRDRVVLNNRPYPLRLVLDQGYWPDGGMTAPDDEALRRDVELVREMGFNGVRKHQKIEDPRYLYWADVRGLLVWGEMPSAYRFTRESVERVTREWTAALDRDYSHPCIMAWVPVNESWGVPNLTDIPAERHYVHALYNLTRTLDPTRPVIGNDGWESVATDIVGIHDYDHDAERLSRRYHADDQIPRIFRSERPGGRLLVLEGDRHAELPIVLSEFGGIAVGGSGSTWGYSAVQNADELASRFEALMKAVTSIGLISGFCYTQFADTYQEANGLLHADRTPKFALSRVAEAVRGRVALARNGPGSVSRPEIVQPPDDSDRGALTDQT